MPVQVASILIPKSYAKWPILDDAYLKGGARVVANAAARDAIYADAVTRTGLKVGQLLVTADDFKVWQYKGVGVWSEFKSGPTSYAHEQVEASDTWAVSHGLGTKFFTYTVFDGYGFQIQPGDCQIVDVDNLTLYFAMPITGHATFVFHAG